MARKSIDIYAPPLVWGTWYDVFQSLGFHGRVTFTERVKPGATTVFYEVKVFPSDSAPERVQGALPGVPFTTYQGTWVRAYGMPTGGAVKLEFEWTFGPI